MARLWLRIVISWAFVISPLACAELDHVNLRLLREYEPPLRWDNVENQPLWSGGVEPVFSRQHRLHLVTLAPGQSSQLQLPPNEMLRLKAIPGGVVSDLNAVEIWTSSDDRLFVRANPSRDHRGENLLIAPNANHIVSVRVVHSALADSPICVSLFVSRHEQVPTPAPYRRSIHVCREEHTICSSDHPNGERFFSLSKGQPREFTVEGPCRIACETWLQFPYGESAIRQSYRVRVDSDGVPPKYLEYDVRSAHRQRVMLDGAQANLSRSAWAYLDCPEGRHRLRLATDHSLYARVMQQECPDHLLGVNEWFTSSATRSAGPLDRLPSFWEVTDEHIAEFGRAHHAESGQEQIALRAARDNTRSGGGLSAWWMMHRVATKHPQRPSLRSVEAKLKGRHTFYRNLLPVASNGSHSFCWYHVNRNASQLESDDGPHSDARTTNEVVVGRDHIRDTLRGMASGSFFPAVSAESGAPLVYVLPTEHGDTQLRVSVIDDREASGSRLFLQYDEGPPIELAMSGDPRPFVAGRIATTEAALSGMWYQHQKLGHGTLGGPFAVGRTPAETVGAATAEIYLPQHVSMVRVWSHADAAELTPKVTLHVRASKYHRLTESEYLANRRRLRMTPSELATRLACDCDHDGREDGYAWRELWNHWRPIVRLLQSHRAVFENGIQPLHRPTEPSNANVDLENMLDRARRLHADREWLAAVEAWSQVLAVASFDARREALVNRATALVEAGEHFLAERQMRAAFLFGEDSIMRLDALSWLKERYSEDQNPDSLERLAAVSFLLAPSTEALTDLAGSFLQNGRYEYALSAALMADDDGSPIARMTAMRAAARIGWWQTYHRLLRTVREPSEREFWRGVRCVYHGAYATANEHFEAAGEKGAAYHSHLANAFSIREQFAASSPDDRAVAVSLWREWNGTHPGPYTWEEDRSVVEHFASSVAAYAVNLDAYSQYFRAHRDAPVRMRVCGPTRLKIESRPIHGGGGSPSEAMDGWLLVSTDGELDSIPITANYPSSTMTLVGTDEVPGQRVEHVVDVPDGVHWIDVRSHTRDVLVRCFVERPEHPITVLPPLSVASETRILEGTFGATHSEPLGMLRMLPDSPHGTVETLAIVRHMSSTTRQRESRLLVHDDSATQVQHSDQINENLPIPRVENPVQKDLPFEAKRRRVSAPQPPLLVPEDVSWIKTRDISADYPHEPLQQWSSPQLTRSKMRVDTEVRGVSHSFRDAAARRLPPVGELHSEGEIRLLSHVEPMVSSSSDQLQLPANANVADYAETANLTRESVGRALRQILWQAESNPSDKLPLQIEGASLHDGFPVHGAIEKDYDRLMRGTTWRAFTQFSSSAGVRVVTVPPWSPESPAARARAALLPQVGENERLLSGDDRLVFSLELSQPEAVEISLSLAAIDYLRALPVDVRIVVDALTHSSVRVDPGDAPIQKLVKLPAGRHSISIGATQRISNHYVRVRVNAANHTVPLLAHRERYYNVATREQPLQLDVAGPARLRIDERRGGHTLTRYVTVKDEVRSITLQPGENEREGLFRVFELISDPDVGDKTSTYQSVQPQHVSPNSMPKSPTINVSRQPDGNVDHRSLVIATPEITLPTVAFEDLFQLGGQEDATWSLSPGWYQRRPVEEGVDLQRPDEFAEFLLTRRFRSDDVSEIARSQVVFRERETAGSTLGIRHAVERPVTWCGAPDVCGGDTYLYVEGTGFVQDTDASLDPATRTAEFSGMLRTRLGQRIRWNEKWSRTQTVTAFARWLSMDENNYRPGEIDQDVFTPYKSDHPAGFTLADAIWYRPFLDTRLSLRGFATSNEGFDPFDMEVIGIRTGWDQAVGPIELSVNYRLARFLNDGDRLDSFTQHVIGVTALVDYWHSPRRRYECGTNVQHNLSASDTSLYFFVSCYFDNGRDYRDFRVGERPFLRLRRLNAAKRPNNKYLFVDG